MSLVEFPRQEFGLIVNSAAFYFSRNKKHTHAKPKGCVSWGLHTNCYSATRRKKAMHQLVDSVNIGKVLCLLTSIIDQVNAGFKIELTLLLRANLIMRRKARWFRRTHSVQISQPAQNSRSESLCDDGGAGAASSLMELWKLQRNRNERSQHNLQKGKGWVRTTEHLTFVIF